MNTATETAGFNATITYLCRVCNRQEDIRRVHEPVTAVRCETTCGLHDRSTEGHPRLPTDDSPRYYDSDGTEIPRRK